MIASDSLFNTRTIAWIVVASLLAAAGFFVLSTYAPSFRVGTGAASVSGKGGTGYAGLARLLEQVGQPPRVVEDAGDLVDAGLLIVPLGLDTDADTLKLIAVHRENKATLYVLPKWTTQPMLAHTGWEYRADRIDTADLTKLVGRIARTRVGTGLTIGVSGCRLAAVQWLADPDPVIAVGPGRALLAKEDGAPHYILADPDLLNNAGLGRPACMAATLGLIARLRPNQEPVMLLGRLAAPAARSLARLVLEPPFLALTLTIVVAAALAFAQGFVRFGPVPGETRAIAFGKLALIDTTARLLQRGARLGGLGERYAALMRTRAAVLTGAPGGLDGAALDRWLDARDPAEPHGFTTRAAALGATRDPAAMHAAAAALHDWVRQRTMGTNSAG